MAINKSFISTNSVEKYNGNTIELISTIPPLDGLIDTPMEPGKLVGYYDGASDSVRLFVVSGSGYRLMRVG